MAVNSIILRLAAKEPPVRSTIELPNGKWAHTADYVRARYSIKQQGLDGKHTVEQVEDRILKMSPEDREILTNLLSME